MIDEEEFFQFGGPKFYKKKNSKKNEGVHTIFYNHN